MRRFLTTVSFGGFRLQAVAAAAADTDAPNWGQVKNLANGLQFKNSVRAAATGNVSLTSGVATYDGVTMNNGDSLLLFNQTDQTQNGIYVWNGVGAALTRRADAVQGYLTEGATVVVDEGTTYAEVQYTCNTSGTITIGTTAITFARSGGGNIYTAGFGLTLTGGAFAVDTTKIARTYKQNVGDGSATSYTINHGLGTRDVIVQVYDNASYDSVEVDVVRTDANNVSLGFGTAPASAAYRVVITG